MKRNEIIELNGVEYTLELNRESFIQIDKLCNIQETMKILQRGMYEYVDGEIDDDFDLESLFNKEEDIEKEANLKISKAENMFTRAFLIWLYPNHKLKISQVKEILKPYFEDDKKFQWLGEKMGYYLQECVAIRESYNQERKNLIAQTNK